jgi:hypothetical protein
MKKNRFVVFGARAIIDTLGGLIGLDEPEKYTTSITRRRRRSHAISEQSSCLALFNFYSSAPALHHLTFGEYYVT